MSETLHTHSCAQVPIEGGADIAPRHHNPLGAGPDRSSTPLITNTNILTPFTFSMFENVGQIVRHARSEGIAVLGINDINTIDGFKDFFSACRLHGIYPLFNVGFPVRCEDDRIGGRSGNSGETSLRTYLHGKALRYPATLSGDSKNLIASIWKASQDRIWKMIDLLNGLCENRHLPIVLKYTEIRSSLAMTSLFEQHLARAVYVSVTGRAKTTAGRIDLFRRLFDDASFGVDPGDEPKMLHEIHCRLLAKDKPAYVDEGAHLFMNFSQARQVILQAGGIPCYQCSFNGTVEATVDTKGPSVLAKHLIDRGIYAVEFITSQTTSDILNEYMRYLADQHFCVTAASGPLCGSQVSFVPATIDGRPLDEALRTISFHGACILAAHQELHKQNRRGFIDETGKRIIAPDQINEFIRLGDEAIRKAVAN